MNNSFNIPKELFDGKYSLEEIGIITLLLHSPNFSKNILEFWYDNKRFHDILNELKLRGVINIGVNDRLTIDLRNKEKMNMKIIKAIDELVGITNCDRIEELKDVLESLAFEFYSQGYQDAEIDYKEEPEPFTAYGKPEDFQ